MGVMFCSCFLRIATGHILYFPPCLPRKSALSSLTPLGVEPSCSERKACLTTQRTPSRSSLLDSLVLCAEMMLDFLFTPCENLKLRCFLCLLPLLKSILSFLFVFSYCLHISRRKKKVKTNCHHIPSDTGTLQYTFYIQYDLY